MEGAVGILTAGQTRIDPAPFVAWVEARRAEHDARERREALLAGAKLSPTAATGALKLALAEIGWFGEAEERSFSALRSGERLTISCDDVLQAFDYAGVPIEDVYPGLVSPTVELEDRYCPTCAERVTTGADGVCPWCETDLSRRGLQAAPEPFHPTLLPSPPVRKPRRVPVRTAKAPKAGWDAAPTVARPEGRLRPAVVPGAPGTGKRSYLTADMVELAKAILDGGATLQDAAQVVWLDPQIRECYASRDSLYQALQRIRARGWSLRAPKAGVYRGELSEATLHEAAWLYYYDQLGFQRIARWLRANRSQAVASYATENSLLNSLYYAFKQRGWPRRDRIEATNIASYRHGLAPREGRDHINYQRWKKRHRKRPRCKGIVRGKKRYGARCARPAKQGSDYCPGHDPAQREEVLERVAAMRSRSHAVVNIWPFTEWLREQRKQFKTQGEMAERLGVPTTFLGRWLKGRAASNATTRSIIKPKTVEKVLAAWGDGTTLEDLYGGSALKDAA
jgi:hypothetical protein